MSQSLIKFIERPKTYHKGPDVMSKSKCAVEQHKKEWATQLTLDSFLAVRGSPMPSPISSRAASTQATIPSDWSQSSPGSPHHSVTDLTGINTEPESLIPQTRPASALSSSADHSGDSDDSYDSTHSDPLEDGDKAVEIEEWVEEDGEDWENELEESVQGPVAIRDWKTLREKINGELKTNRKTLLLGHIDQFLILCNFATLQIKGFTHTDASLDIAQQWQEGGGNYYVWHVRALA